MKRSSLAATTLALGLLVLGSVACGDKPPPKPPESTPSSEDGGGSSSSSGDSDGGATASGGSEGGKTTSGGGDTPAAASGLALPSAAAKIKFKNGKKDVDLEVKSDGTVNNGGKASAKISGMELQSPDGKAQLKVDGDGNITTADGAAYAKFDGDDLSAQNGTKYSIGEDGALSSTNDKGAKTAMGKSEGVGSAKRASLLAVGFTMWGMKAPAAAGGKKGDKPKGDKPKGDKPKKP